MIEMKKALTYTIIAGSRTCPNDCPICISKMTPDYGIGNEEPEVNWKKFQKSTIIALNHDVENVLITGKGEPTLYPGQISRYLIRLHGKEFDKRELQTDGSILSKGGLYNQFLDVWKDLDLDTVAISIYHYDEQKNKEIFRPKSGEYFDLPRLIEKIHSKDMNTRLSCVMLDGYIDDVEDVAKLIEYSKKHGVYQLTLRTADKPKDPLDLKTAGFVDRIRLSEEKLKEINGFLEKEGEFCDELAHGALVYEVHGQNVCLTTGLTPAKRKKDEVRQLIFFPQGWLTTSWENVMGGRIL